MSKDIVMAAAGGTGAAVYVEDVFSTYLYTGNGSTQTITNGIDLAGKGGLVWTKRRDAVGYGNYFIDTVRGATKAIESSATSSEFTYSDSLTAFTSSGYTLGADSLNGGFNNGAGTQVSWSFRKQPKFFDIVTYTGNGSVRTISHSLGSTPGCIIVKGTSAAATNWRVYHSGLTSAAYSIQLNQTNAQSNQPSIWNSTAPTSSVFSVGGDPSVNDIGQTYVAYIFASNAGGFGLTGTDNVISCGSFNDLAGTVINLGYEPQYVLLKVKDTTGPWDIYDTVRGFTANSTGNAQALYANTSAAEVTATGDITITSTGFVANGNYGAGNNFIYIAIRRGPMKVPTSGTSVFAPLTRTATGANATVSSLSFPTDASWFYLRSRAGYGGGLFDRVRGANNYLLSYSFGRENNVATTTALTSFASNVGFTIGTDDQATVANTFSGDTGVIWNFRRAPSFFDVVCYTGNDVSRNLNHNLGTTPQLWLIKARSTNVDWSVGSSLFPSTTNDYLTLNLTDAKASLSNFWNTPTSTTFGFGSGLPSAANINQNGITYVAYLFASCPGVSKVGSYTGNGSTQTINCSFTGGARFVLIKRTDSTGDWYVYDTARGIVAANDPHLSLNTTAAEVTTDDSIDPDSTGFIVNQVAATNINVTSATYIYLAIA